MSWIFLFECLISRACLSANDIRLASLWLYLSFDSASLKQDSWLAGGLTGCHSPGLASWFLAEKGEEKKAGEKEENYSRIARYFL